MSKIHCLDSQGAEQIIERDYYHTDADPLLTAYDTREDGSGVENKVSIPLSRVVLIRD